VVAYRLKDEYGVDCAFEAVNVHTARWVQSDDAKAMEELEAKAMLNMARDAAGALVYLASSRVNLQLTIERHPKVQFLATKEYEVGKQGG
jgi:peptide chain release factor 3